MKYLINSGGSMTTQPTQKGLTTTTPYEVAKRFHPNIEHINMSRAGSGNLRASITIQNYFHENPDKIKESIVIVGWISQYVIDLLGGKDWNRDQTFSKQYEKYANSVKNGIHEDTHEMNYFFHILSLQTFLKYHKIPYFFYSAHHYPFNVSNPAVKNLMNQIDGKYFYNLIEKSQYEWLQEEKLSISEDHEQQRWLQENNPKLCGVFDPHASQKGCEIYGEMIYNHIKKKGIEL